MLNQLPLPKTTIHYIQISPDVDADQRIKNIKIKQARFYKPQGKHFLFKKTNPRWICPDIDFDYKLFHQIFGDNLHVLTEYPENGYEQVIEPSTKKQIRLAFEKMSKSGQTLASEPW